MQFVAVNSAESQAMLAGHAFRRGHALERTALVNRTRGLLGEVGVWVARTPQRLSASWRSTYTMNACRSGCAVCCARFASSSPSLRAHSAPAVDRRTARPRGPLLGDRQN